MTKIPLSRKCGVIVSAEIASAISGEFNSKSCVKAVCVVNVGSTPTVRMSSREEWERDGGILVRMGRRALGRQEQLYPFYVGTLIITCEKG